MEVGQELWFHGQTVIVTLYNNTFNWVFKKPSFSYLPYFMSCVWCDSPLPPFRIYISFHPISVLILSVFLDDKINYLFLESVCWRGWEKGRKIIPGLDFFVYPFCIERVIVNFSETILMCVPNEELNLAANKEEKTMVAICGYLKIGNRSAL